MLGASELPIFALRAALRAVALRNAAAAAVRQGFGPQAQNACTAQKRRPAVRGPGLVRHLYFADKTKRKTR